jgi:hypothetical protein
MVEKKVFISYSRADSAVVFPLVERLQKAVGDVFWMDLDGIESGDQFVDVIIDAIDKTEIVLFMHSASSLGSEWVKKEIQYAQGMKKKIVPILVDGNSLRGWFLFHFVGNDFIDPTNEMHCNKLIRDLKSWVEIEEMPDFDDPDFFEKLPQAYRVSDEEAIQMAKDFEEAFKDDPSF